MAFVGTQTEFAAQAIHSLAKSPLVSLMYQVPAGILKFVWLFRSGAKKAGAPAGSTRWTAFDGSGLVQAPAPNALIFTSPGPVRVKP